jgi:hypothetical protein
LPSVERYPHAPWWVPQDGASLNPTAAIAGLLHKHGVQHPWLESADQFCWENATAFQGVHDLISVLTFLENAPDRDRAERLFDDVGARMLSEGLVAFDPAAPGYVKGPLDYAPEPTSLSRRLFSDETMAVHLEALAAAQAPDGGWPITWEPPSEAAALEWRGCVTVNALLTLQAYGWLSTPACGSYVS